MDSGAAGRSPAEIRAALTPPKRWTAAVIVGFLAVVAGAMAVTKLVFPCRPPADEAQMIEVFEADPLSAVAPDDGELVEQRSLTYWCDSGMRHGGSPTGPGFAEVRMRYRTPTAYSLDRLRQLFDPAATAGGWTGTSDSADGYARLKYTKRVGCRSVRAAVMSSATAIYVDGSGGRPGIDMNLSAPRECDIAGGGG